MEFSSVFGDGRDWRTPTLCLAVKQHLLGLSSFSLCSQLEESCSLPAVQHPFSQLPKAQVCPDGQLPGWVQEFLA